MSDEAEKYVNMSIREILIKHGVWSELLELDLLRHLVDKIIMVHKTYQEREIK